MVDSVIQKVSTWIMRLAFVNILWIIFSLLGFIFVGLFPATVAMFAIVRHWIRGDTEINLFKTFWYLFKGNILKANILGYCIVFGGTVLYFDFLLFQDINSLIGEILLLISLTIGILYLMIVLFIFPIYVHFEIKTLEYIKYAFIIGASYPLHTFYIGLSVFIIYYVTASFPVIFIFFSGSFLSLIIMRFAYTAFEKIEKKNGYKKISEPIDLTKV